MDNPTELRRTCFTHNSTMYNVYEDGSGGSLWSHYHRNAHGRWMRTDGVPAFDGLNARFEQAYQQLIGGQS